MAKVALVRPPVQVAKWSDSGPLTPPIGPAYLAAALRAKGHEVSILDALGASPFQHTSLYGGSVLAIGLTNDEVVERIPAQVDIIGFTVMFSQDWPHIRTLIEKTRRYFPSVIIVVGGEHITAVREFSLIDCQEIDLCAIGEGEETIVDIAHTSDLGEGYRETAGLIGRDGDGFFFSGPRPRIKSIDNIEEPAWDLVSLDSYLDNGLGYGVDLGRNLPMLATRGCPYQCTFCSNPEMWTTKWISRKPELVLNEMLALQERYDVSNFDFYDLTAIVKRDWIIKFTDLILSQENRFFWQLPSGTRSEAIDREVCRRLYESGCRNMSYAPESGSPAVLKRIKKVVKLERLEKSVQGAVREKLNVKLNIIIGFPDESMFEAIQTLRFLVRMAWVGAHDAAVSQFSPYPGSEIYADLRESGAIPNLSDDYFLSLGAYKDISNTVSYSEKIGPRTLNLLRVLGLLIFYSIQYFRRPLRLFVTLSNLFSGRQESRLDKSLQDLKGRLKANRLRESKHIS